MKAASSTEEKSPTSQTISVSIGRNSVKIYHRPPDRGRTARWMIPDYSTGKRSWRTFADEKTARAEASRIVTRLNAGDAEGAGMTGADRRDLQRANSLVAPHKVDVPTACALFAEACDLIGHENLIAAAKDYARRAPVARTTLPVGKAVFQFLELKAARGRSPRTLDNLRHRLGRFAVDHAKENLAEFTTGKLQNWLDNLTNANGGPLSTISRRNYAVSLGGLFEFYRRRGVLPDNLARDLEREKGKRKPIQFCKPAEVSSLLSGLVEIRSKALAGMVLGMFVGLRTSEICRAKWGDLNFQTGYLTIVGVKAGVELRNTQLSEDVQKFLRPLAGASEDRIFPWDNSVFCREISDVCKSSEILRTDNFLRKSFITYSAAATGDLARVGESCGTDAVTIRQFYRGLATKDDSTSFFKILTEATK